LDLSASGGSDELDTFVQAAHKNGVKALASIGGWTGSGYWSDNVATEASRTAFVKTVSDMISKHNLDGIDYDWEYPVVGGETCNNYSPSDTANYLAFAQAMRAANPDIIMSAAAGVTPWKDASGTPSSDVSAFAHALDWVAIMNYDEYGQFTSTAGPNAALNDSCAPAAARQGSAVAAVAAWTAAGMPAGQLVLGVASYGHAFNVSTGDALPSGGSKLALFPPFRPWTLAAGETAPTECGAVVAKDVQYTFAGLVQAGFLKADGTAADGIHTIYDDCSQTVSSHQTIRLFLDSFVLVAVRVQRRHGESRFLR
jgi:chitinase